MQMTGTEHNRLKSPKCVRKCMHKCAMYAIVCKWLKMYWMSGAFRKNRTNVWISEVLQDHEQVLVEVWKCLRSQPTVWQKYEDGLRKLGTAEKLDTHVKRYKHADTSLPKMCEVWQLSEKSGTEQASLVKLSKNLKHLTQIWKLWKVWQRSETHPTQIRQVWEVWRRCEKHRIVWRISETYYEKSWKVWTVWQTVWNIERVCNKLEKMWQVWRVWQACAILMNVWTSLTKVWKSHNRLQKREMIDKVQEMSRSARRSLNMVGKG